ncbi:MAG: sensor histidine kinase [Nitrospiraceae bacterium]
MTSFRGQIRLAAIILLLGLLMVFNMVVYWGFQTLLTRYVDGRLVELADILAHLVAERPELLQAKDGEILPEEAGRQPVDEHTQELREVSHRIQILAPNGTVVFKGEDVIPLPPVSQGALEEVRRGQAVYDTVDAPNGSPVRRVLVPVGRHGEVRFVLQAEASLDLVQRTLRNLMGLLILCSVAAMVAAWAGSAWLARRVLEPLAVLSRTAEKISASSLRTRLNLDAPYEEFRQLAEAFNAMLDRLQKASESQRSFVDSAAHELQTPLTVLRGNLEVSLQKMRTAEEYREALITNLEQVERLMALAKSLLTLARFAGDRPPVQLAPLALEPMLRDLIEDLVPLAEDRMIRLTLECEPVLPVHGDAQKLKQLIINLLDNAMRYTDPGGAVAVRLSGTPDEVCIAVQDTGQGIEAAHLPHLFERFYRVDHSRTRDVGGTGLGLSIVKEIADSHKGSIRVESEVGKGSTFTLALPAIKS